VEKGDKAGMWLLAGLIAGGVFVIVFNNITCDAACLNDWRGGKGWLEIALAAGTFGAAIVAGYLAWQSYLMNRSVAAASRFQKGAEMLADRSPTVATAGVRVLIGLLDDRDTEAYRRPVLDAFLAAVAERDGEMKRKISLFDDHRPLYPGVWELSDMVTAQAIAAIAVSASYQDRRTQGPHESWGAH
jgi:hypothetical protein